MKNFHKCFLGFSAFPVSASVILPFCYLTSIYGKCLIIEEPPLQCIFHLHSIHCVLFGLQSQFL